MGSDNPKSASEKKRDILFHLEAYLAKRDGIDKLLKISRYATKIIILSSSSSSSSSSPLISRIKSFESSVGVSRKAFRLGKFVQDLNALRLTSSSKTLSRTDRGFTYLAYGGEGVYYFLEQFVWVVKTGLIPKEYGSRVQKISAWAELIGYVGSVALKISEVKRIKLDLDEEKEMEMVKGRRLREKLLMKQMSIIQDFADALMALGDVRDGKGAFTGPILMASAGLLSAIISTHKNWQSC